MPMVYPSVLPQPPVYITAPHGRIALVPLPERIILKQGIRSPLTATSRFKSKTILTIRLKAITPPKPGQVTLIKTQLGTNSYREERRHYDAFHRLSWRQTPGSSRQHIRYNQVDGSAPTHAVMQISTYQSGSPQSKVYQDKLGRAIRSATQGFDGSWRYQNKQYNHRGQLLFESQQSTDINTPFGVRYTDYDMLGRATGKTIDQACGGTMAMTYDYQGHNTDITAVDHCDGKSLSLSRSYNGLNQLISTTDALNGVTRYSYNALGMPIVLEDVDGNKIQTWHDALGRKTKVVDPNQGTTDYVYNGFGELQQQIQRRNAGNVNQNDVTVTLLVDALGRVYQRRATGEATYYYRFDSAANGYGQLANESGNGASRHYTYDALGRRV